MEEVPAHVHPRSIIPDVLSRQHEHRSGLIWSGDRETCYTDLQCRRFGPNPFQCYSTAPRILILAWSRIPTLRPQLMTEIQADPLAPLGAIWCTTFDCSQLPTHTLYITWYRGITRVYISNPPNRDTYSHGYQPAGVDRQMMEMDDMASVAIWEPPSSPSQMATVMKKVQTIIWRTISSRRSLCSRRVAIPGSTYRTEVLVELKGVLGDILGMEQEEHLDPDPAMVERGEGSGSGQQYVDPFDSPNLDMPSFSLGLMSASQPHPSGSGTSQMPPAPGLVFASFQSPHSIAYGFFSFRAPPPLSTVGSSTPHQPISQASSSDEKECQDDKDGVQALGFGHRVG
ncbi:hypothetical protein M9H77_14555 [Catharanthus roseus]|uniref:Uncharacterized protein n=1 Tax=Catharanthus roseus TaxID=4058 RepID=A0ACC0BND4_CATRO|nr:hypothetical protein M9H77_14555 [Catharanthus roseus]